MSGKNFAKVSTNVLQKIFTNLFSYSPGLGEIICQSNLDLTVKICIVSMQSVMSSASYERVNFVMKNFEKECVIHGYHVYEEIWESTIGKELDCRQEPSNTVDRYAVAVMKSRIVVGHSPKKLSRTSLSIRRGSVIRCHVAGRRTYSHDLPQGGLEIPCVLILEGKYKELE